MLFTGGIVKYMDIGSGKELRPLTQCITRVITYFHCINENRAYRWNGLMEPKEAVYKVMHPNRLLD